MRNPALLLIIASFVYLAYHKFTASEVSVITSSDGVLLLEKGRNKMELEELGEVTVDLRLFGAQPNKDTGGVGPFVFVSHMVFATPLATNEAIFDKFLCERKSVDKASLIQLIISDNEIESIFENIAEIEGRRCARLEGVSYEISRFFLDEEDITESMQFTPAPNSDPWKMLKVTGLSRIDC